MKSKNRVHHLMRTLTLSPHSSYLIVLITDRGVSTSDRHPPLVCAFERTDRRC